MTFKDHFSGHSASYARYRPRYPAELFEYLASLTATHDVAVDCACGSGQASGALAKHYRLVVGSDASVPQLMQADRYENVAYVGAPAERQPLQSQTVDMFAVAQAAHWFDFTRFYAEVTRVLRPTGILAIWAYGLARIEPQIDELVYQLYERVLGQYWPAERRYIDAEYRTLPFALTEIPAPTFTMTLQWTLDEWLGYLETWSALQRYRKALGTDPLPTFRTEISKAWNSADMPRSVNWPIYLRLGRV